MDDIVILVEIDNQEVNTVRTTGKKAKIVEKATNIVKRSVRGMETMSEAVTKNPNKELTEIRVKQMDITQKDECI